MSGVAAYGSTWLTPTGASPSDRIVVGHVARAHGIRGEVVVEVRSDVPERRFAVGSVLLTDHPEVPSLTVAGSRPHSGKLLVTFDEVLTRDVAEALKSTLLLIASTDIGSAVASGEADDSEVWWDADLIGLTARMVDGAPLGEVVNVLHNPGGELLVIARDGASELLVPFVAAMVPVVDLEQGEVVVDPPPGLLEL